MKKKIREQLRWVITCIVGLFCLWFLPSVTLATSTTAYPITTEYQEITDIAGVKNNFSLSGDPTKPAYWDPNSDYAILTEDKQYQLGSMYLNNKVQLDSNFSITGKEMVYFKKGTPMADGIGIIFHTGAVNQAGNKGGDLGVGGLPNALGFVFDFYRNAGDPVVPYIGIWSTDSTGTISRDKNIATPTLQNLATGYYTFDYSFTYNSTTSPRTITFQMKYNGVNLIDGDGYVLNIPNDVYEYSFAITASTGFYNTFQAVKVDKSSIPILVTNTPTVTKEVGSTYATTLTLKDKTSTDPKILANYPDGVPYPAGSVVTVNGTDYTVDDNSSITVPLGATDTETDLTIAVKSFKEYNNQKFDGRVSDSITYTRQQRFWGNVPWSFDSDTGTLTFTSGGTFSTKSDSPWNRTDALKISNTDVKKIVFTNAVSTSSDASFLFGGYTTGDVTNLPNLASIEGLTHLDTSEATSMAGMFLNASALTNLDLSKFNTSKVNNMQYMFGSASSLTSLDLTNFNTSQVTTMYQMFSSASKLTDLNLTSFDTSNVTNMMQFLSGASSLTAMDLSNFNTNKVTNMSYMFSGMSSLTSLNISNFDTTTLSPNIKSAFLNTTALKSLTLGSKFKDTSNESQLPNITANDTYSGNWQYQVDESIVGTTSQFFA
ncbi:lectin-like domain-containing protein, partial [Enterococcus sp. LJL90]